jgi:hypothetical protein
MCREGGSSLNDVGGGGFLTGARSLAGEDRARAGIERVKERENTGRKENTEKSELSRPLRFFQDLL